MKVVSKLVELDFQIDRIETSKNGIVILNDPEKSMSTKVYVTPSDAMTIARVVLGSGAAWRFMFTFPFSHFFGKKKKANRKKV